MLSVLKINISAQSANEKPPCSATPSHREYRSKRIDDAWPLGFCALDYKSRICVSVGLCDFEP